MKAPLRLALLCALGPLAVACLDNRPIIVAENDAGSPSQMGAAGSGSAGATVTGTAGAATAGANGGAGQTGAVARGCDITQLITAMPMKYSCTLAGACHDAAQSATGLDMTSVGWERKLVGTFPSNGSQGLIGSLCLGSTEPYLIAGSAPARGLFLDKLKPNPPCGIEMPNLGSHVTATDFDCFQRWANALTAP